MNAFATSSIKSKFLLIISICIIISIFIILNYSIKFTNHQNTQGNFQKQSIKKESGLSTHQDNKWKTYYDTQYNYSIEYPSGLRVVPIKQSTNEDKQFANQLVEAGGVSFASLGPGVMGVKIYTNTSFTNPEEWLVFENNKNEKLRRELEKRITINGYEALVTHLVSILPEQEEHFSNEKKTVFIKDKNLFLIWTKFYDEKNNHEKVWNSFKFKK